MSNPAFYRFLQDRQGKIALVFALSLVPIVFLAGMAMDFTSAEVKKTQLDAGCDDGGHQHPGREHAGSVRVSAAMNPIPHPTIIMASPNGSVSRCASTSCAMRRRIS